MNLFTIFCILDVLKILDFSINQMKLFSVIYLKAKLFALQKKLTHHIIAYIVSSIRQKNILFVFFQ